MVTETAPVCDGKYKFHPACEIFPAMTPVELHELVEDIRQNGLLVPILTYKGEIIDGRHRHECCLELGIEPKFREWDGSTHGGSVVALVVCTQRPPPAPHARPESHAGGRGQGVARKGDFEGNPNLSNPRTNWEPGPEGRPG